jgi:purine-binding chemotaxis protein CheW
MNAVARATSASAAVATAEQFLTFEVGDELFAIPILAVQEIRGWERVAQTPRTEPHVLGVVDLRGTVVPVLDARVRLGMVTREVTSTTVLIVVRVSDAVAGATTVGCVVDTVSDVAVIAAEQVRPAPVACGSVHSHFISGVATIDRRLVLLLDLGRLVNSGTGA